LDDFITIAKIVKVRGIKGEVSAEVLTDFPDRFSRVGRLRLWRVDQTLSTQLEEFRFHGTRLILKFQGFDNPEAVRPLLGSEIQIPTNEAVDLPDGFYFHFQLIGCRVFEKIKLLGQVVDVMETAEVANLEVRTSQDTVFMIPLVKRFVTKVDIEGRILKVVLPDGLFELAEPLPNSKDFG